MRGTERLKKLMVEMPGSKSRKRRVGWTCEKDVF